MKIKISMKIKDYDQVLPGLNLPPGVIMEDALEFEDDTSPVEIAVTLLDCERSVMAHLLELRVTETD